MIDVPSLIDIVHGGIENLTESDKANIRYEIKQSGASRSLYLYKTIKSTGILNILRISDHLPSMQTMVRSDSTRPSAYSNANVSIDFYIPKKEEHIDNATGKKTIRNVRNRFDNHVGVPSSIPAVEPFTVSSYEYFYKNLEQKDEMIIWHCIATWICCLDPYKAYHDPFAQDETKRAIFKMKTANVKVFGDKAEITESRTTENMKVVITENDLQNIVRECVRRIIKEHYEDNSLYGWNAVERTARNGGADIQTLQSLRKSYDKYGEECAKRGQIPNNSGFKRWTSHIDAASCERGNGMVFLDYWAS